MLFVNLQSHQMLYMGILLKNSASRDKKYLSNSNCRVSFEALLKFWLHKINTKKSEWNYLEISKTRSLMFLMGFIQFAKSRPELFLNRKVTNFSRRGAYGLRRILKLFKEAILRTFSWSFFKLALTRPLQLETYEAFFSWDEITFQRWYWGFAGLKPFQVLLPADPGCRSSDYYNYI